MLDRRCPMGRRLSAGKPLFHWDARIRFSAMYRPRKRKRGTRWGRISIVLRESSVWVHHDVPCLEEKWRRSLLPRPLQGTGRPVRKASACPIKRWPGIIPCVSKRGEPRHSDWLLFRFGWPLRCRGPPVKGVQRSPDKNLTGKDFDL